MQHGPSRQSVDLAAYPDLVVILLGLRLRSFRAIPAFLNVGRGLGGLQHTPPEGLLANEQFLWGWNHIGIRQYWRDLPSLEAFTRQSPHSGWWKSFLQDPSDCGFWHEIYSAGGGMEAIYINMPSPTGMGRFAAPREATGPYQSSGDRLRLDAARRRARPEAEGDAQSA